jgi:predicted hotdog family 3-hydroxylacyl-ACP dehydratase
MSGTSGTEAWHLDKRVPLALILTLAAQTLGVGWWAATLQAEQMTQRIQIEELRQARAVSVSEERRIAEALARLDERLRAQTEILQRLDRATRP